MTICDSTVSGPDHQAMVAHILDASLKDNDFFAQKSRLALKNAGFCDNAAKILIARHKSAAKYGYRLDEATLDHLLNLASAAPASTPLNEIFEAPFLLMKAGWLYEHAPYFADLKSSSAAARDQLICDFAGQYKAKYLDSRIDFRRWHRIREPRRVIATTFWERNIIDPVGQIGKAMADRIEGLELNFDFHPFNFAKLLPEEISTEKRHQIKMASIAAGVKIDLHSPIIGPYVPSPDPAVGYQQFFDPTRCSEVQYETIALARDINAGAVVFHLIDSKSLDKMAELIEAAAGSDVRVTIENYTYTDLRQNCENFLACLQDISDRLPPEVRRRNFGVTMDVGHFNIEGEDPLVAARHVGRWCLDNHVFLRMHATDNYGDLTFSPPAYSADVHGNVSGRGIDNALIIKLLRSMGLEFRVVAEQIHPLTPLDIQTIDNAQTHIFKHAYRHYVDLGRERLKNTHLEAFFEPEIISEPAYAFLAGLKDIQALREYLLYRRIQSNKNLSVEEARRISQEFIRMPVTVKNDLTAYIDDFLLFTQGEYGSIKKSDFDLVCQNVSGALFASIRNEHLDQIFKQTRTYEKGAFICRQKEAGQEMYYIKVGEVAVDIDGSRVATLGPGEIFGEMSLFYDIDRSADVIALKEGTVVGVLTREGLEQVFKSDRLFARDLITRFFNILPGRLRNLNEKYKTAIRTLNMLENKPAGSDIIAASVDQAVERERRNYFPTLRPDEATQIFQQTRSYDTGNIIFRENETADGAYYIVSGKVKITAGLQEGGEIRLAHLGAGEIFGEMALIDDTFRSAAVTALAPTRTAFVNRRDFFQYTQSRSPQAVRLMGFICLSLFKSILCLDKLYSDLKRKIKRSMTTSSQG